MLVRERRSILRTELYQIRSDQDWQSARVWPKDTSLSLVVSPMVMNACFCSIAQGQDSVKAGEECDEKDL